MVINLTRQTEKPEEKDSKPPERKSRPPTASIPPQKGDTLPPGAKPVTKSKHIMIGAKAQPEGIARVEPAEDKSKIKREKLREGLGTAGRIIEIFVDGEVKPVKGRLDTLENERSRLERHLLTAKQRAKKARSTAERVARDIEEIRVENYENLDDLDEHDKAIGKLEADVNELKDDIYENLYSIQVFEEQIEKIEREQHELSTLRSIVEAIYVKVDGFKKGFGKALGGEIANRGREIEDLKDAFGGLLEEFEKVKTDAEEAKGAAGGARTAAVNAEEHLKIATQIAEDVIKRHGQISDDFEGLSSDLKGMKKDVERLSMPPAESASEADDYVEEQAGRFASLVPGEVLVVDEEQLNTINEKIRSVSEKLDEHEKYISKLEEYVDSLAESEEARERESVLIGLDISGYEGHDALDEPVIKMMANVAAVVNTMRNQEARVAGLREETKALLKLHGLDKNGVLSNLDGHINGQKNKPEKVTLEKTNEIVDAARIAVETLMETERELGKHYDIMIYVNDQLDIVVNKMAGVGE